MHDADVSDELKAEFADQVPESTVARIVDSAERDLEGQVTAEARPELVHRLAHARLCELVA